MRTIAFENEFTYTGNKAIGSVQLIHPRITLKVEMTLDSGAEISVLNRSFIAQLGLTLSTGAPIGLMVANGDIAQAYIHPVEINFLGRRMTIEAAFCPDWDTANLLGMRGFVDQTVVAFDHAQRRLYVK